MNLIIRLGVLGLGAVAALNIALAADVRAEPRAELGEKGRLQAAAAGRGVEARLYYSEMSENGEVRRTPKLEVKVGGVVVLSIGSEESWLKWPSALAQIVEMDPSNPYPEVVFATFSGGAHCCNVVQIAVSSKDGKSWSRVDGGMYDGDVRGAEDADGDGRYELVNRDNRFLYAFSSYAGSLAPTQIQRLQNGALVNVTRKASFRPRLLQEHENIRRLMGDVARAQEKNGFLAGYVAQSALIGDGAQAWNFMLRHYDRKATEGLVNCTAGYDDQGKCKAAEVRFKDFPQALAAFLRQSGYLPAR